MTNPSLPQELIIEIFARLPQKSIGKCKCLSKSWLSLLSKPQFLNLCLVHYGNLILINPSHSLHLLLSTPMINNDAVSRKLELPGSWTEVVGSCKGLVLLTNKEGELYLVNPITSLIVKIPGSDLALKKSESTRTHGFGYDTSSNDYKIVTLSYNYVSGSLAGVKMFVDVYSVKMGVWKRIYFPYDNFVPENDPNVSGVFVNGYIHWQAFSTWDDWNRASCLIAFDLANEVFCEMCAPFILSSAYHTLIVRVGRLCVVPSYFTPGGGGDVWTMEEYGSAESWKRFSIPDNEDCPQMKPLCFLGEEMVVLRAEDGRLFMYDVKEERMKEFVVDGAAASCINMGNSVGQ